MRSIPTYLQQGSNRAATAAAMQRRSAAVPRQYPASSALPKRSASVSLLSSAMMAGGSAASGRSTRRAAARRLRRPPPATEPSDERQGRAPSAGGRARDERGAVARRNAERAGRGRSLTIRHSRGAKRRKNCGGEKRARAYEFLSGPGIKEVSLRASFVTNYELLRISEFYVRSRFNSKVE